CATASGGKAVAQTFKGLRPQGVTLVLGASTDPIEVASADLLFSNRGTGGMKAVAGSLTGTPAEGDATLRFSTLTGVAAMIETMPLEKAPEAYAKMLSGKARIRMVLTMAR